MGLQLLDNATLMNVMASSVQGACAQLLNFTVGSVLRAVLQANASVALWLQWLITQVLLTTRAATSNGADLDSWVGDYGLQRLPAVAAQGEVTLFRNVATNAVPVSPGGMLRTGDGSQSFVIIEETGNAAWNGAANTYVLGIGVNSILVPVAAVVAGQAGNVQAGTITLLASSIPGIDTVTNAVPVTGGLDAESDAALRARASLYFASLSRATKTAVRAAVAGVQQGLQVLVQDTLPQAGQFIVVVDDGSGAPPATLLQSVYTAVDAVRPIGSVFTVQGPVVQLASIVVNLTTDGTANLTTLQAQIGAAATAMVQSLPIGATLAVTRVAAIAYAQSAAVLNAGVTLNGAAVDLVPAANGVVRVGAVTVQ